MTAAFLLLMLQMAWGKPSASCTCAVPCTKSCCCQHVPSCTCIIWNAHFYCYGTCTHCYIYIIHHTYINYHLCYTRTCMCLSISTSVTTHPFQHMVQHAILDNVHLYIVVLLQLRQTIYHFQVVYGWQKIVWLLLDLTIYHCCLTVLEVRLQSLLL